MVIKIKDETLKKLSKRLEGENQRTLAPESNNSKLNCWACGKYYEEAEECNKCQNCSLWTLKKIFLHNRRYLRYLDNEQLQKMGFSG